MSPSSVIRSRVARPVVLGLLSLAVAGCATDGASSGGAKPARVSLPAAFSSRWSPPEFATRPVDGERSVVLNACVDAANAAGFSVSRLAGALGKVSAARRQTSAFDGSRQDTLEITVTTLAPGSSLVALVLREAIEPASGEAERSGGIVTTSLVRDRAPYDTFFARLTAALRPADAPAPAATAASAP